MPAAGGSHSDAAALFGNEAGVPAASRKAAGPGACWQEQACLQQLPETLLESIMAQTDVATVCQAARTCRTLHTVRLAALLWMVCTRLLHRTACREGVMLFAPPGYPATLHLDGSVLLA